MPDSYRLNWQKTGIRPATITKKARPILEVTLLKEGIWTHRCDECGATIQSPVVDGTTIKEWSLIPKKYRKETEDLYWKRVRKTMTYPECKTFECIKEDHDTIRLLCPECFDDFRCPKCPK